MIKIVIFATLLATGCSQNSKSGSPSDYMQMHPPRVPKKRDSIAEKTHTGLSMIVQYKGSRKLSDNSYQYCFWSMHNGKWYVADVYKPLWDFTEPGTKIELNWREAETHNNTLTTQDQDKPQEEPKPATRKEQLKTFLDGWSQAELWTEEEIGLALYKACKDKYPSTQATPDSLFQLYKRKYLHCSPILNIHLCPIHKVDLEDNYYIHPDGIKEIKNGEW